MLLYEPESNVQIRSHKPLVDINRRSPPCRAQAAMRLEVPRIVANHAILCRNLRPHNLPDLVFGRAPVQPSRNQNRDPLHRNSRLMQPFQQRRQRNPIRRRPRNIAHGNRSRLLPRRQCRQRFTADGIVERRSQSRIRILQRHARPAANHLAIKTLRNRNLNPVFAECELCFHLFCPDRLLDVKFQHVVALSRRRFERARL